MPSIVQVTVSQSAAAAPITFQAAGALISQGGTNLSSGATGLLTQVSDLTPLLSNPLALSSLVWSGGSVVATTTAPISGLTSGDTFTVTIAGATPTGYNGTYTATVTGASAFSFPLTPNPGSETVPGTYTPPSQADLSAMVGTFFGQGTSNSVSVLELGAGDGTTGPAALNSWIAANPGIFYSYLVPRGWDGKTGLITLLNQNTALTAKTNFFVTTTASNSTLYTQNSALTEVEAPGIPLTEFSLAADFQRTLSYAPSATNRMTPNAFSFLNGVTPYPTQGNQTLLTALKTANCNYVGTGAEGGLSNTILFWGTMADGNDFSYWYSVDWIQLNGQQAVANAVINGSNDSLNPLWYSQDGINRLQDVLVGTFKSAVTFGLSTGTVTRTALSTQDFTTAFNNGTFAGQNVVNAVPFLPYLQNAPGDYKLGRYAGLSGIYIPSRGFKQIIFGVLVTDFVTAE